MDSFQFQIGQLSDLANRLEYSTNFEIDARTFAAMADSLQQALYNYTDDPDILDLLDEIQSLDLSPHRRSLLEELLPRGARELLGNKHTKEKILEQVQSVNKAFRRIGRLLPPGGEYV